MKNYKMLAVLFGMLVLSVNTGLAQSPNSNKQFLVANTNGVAVINLFTNVELFRGYIKTSNVGAIMAGVSMECVLWTYTSTTGTTGGGKNSTSARATVVVNVSVDGSPAIPGQVVYCDRLQAVGVTLVTGVATDQLTIELFQATKNANHFNFFKGPLSSTLHEVIVTATGTVECRNNAGAVIACPSGVLVNAAADTLVGIGKSTLVLEEFQNSNL